MSNAERKMTEKIFYYDSHIRKFEAKVLRCDQIGEAAGGTTGGVTGDVVGEAVGGAVGGAMDGSVNGAVGGAVDGSVNGSVDGSEDGSVAGAMGGAVEGMYNLVLDRTAFYPEGGGQAADRGTIDGIEVLDVQEEAGEVLHKVGRYFEPGTEVVGELDWDYRFSNMQQHSGEHIISGIINRRWGYNNVGFHIGTDFVTLDFDGTFTEAELNEVELEANRAIYANIPILSKIYETEGDADVAYRSKIEVDGPLRVITVPEYDVCACCGTHVKLTGEIGLMKILSAKKYKGGTRVSVLCGERALEDFKAKHRSVSEISVLLSAKPEDVSAAAKQLNELNEELAFKVKGYKDRIIGYISASLDAEGKHIYVFEDGLEPDDLRKLALLVAERAVIAAVFSGNGMDGYKYAVASEGIDCRIVTKEMNGVLKGRGGGTAKLTQGSVPTDRKNIELFFGQHNKEGGKWEGMS